MKEKLADLGGAVLAGSPADFGKLIADETEGGVAGVVGIESSVVSGVLNLESSGVDAPDWRPRHDKQYHEA